MNTNQTILNEFISKHPFAAAQALDTSQAADVAEFLQTLPLDKTLRLLDLMTDRKAADCFVLLPNKKTTELLEKGEPYVLASILKLTEDTKQKELLTKVSPNKLNIIKRNMENAPNTVGAFMETAISVNKEMSIEDAITIIKRHPQNEELQLYVVNLEGILSGVVRLKELLFADKDDILKSVMIRSFPKFLPDEKLKDVADYSIWLDHRHIPVVDKTAKLLGTLSYKTTMDNLKASINLADNEIQETGGALGELYRIGITGLLQSVGK